LKYGATQVKVWEGEIEKRRKVKRRKRRWDMEASKSP
jgi:hypothetical protein